MYRQTTIRSSVEERSLLVMKRATTSEHELRIVKEQHVTRHDHPNADGRPMAARVVEPPLIVHFGGYGEQSMGIPDATLALCIVSPQTDRGENKCVMQCK